MLRRWFKKKRGPVLSREDCGEENNVETELSISNRSATYTLIAPMLATSEDTLCLAIGFSMAINDDKQSSEYKMLLAFINFCQYIEELQGNRFIFEKGKALRDKDTLTFYINEYAAFEKKIEDVLSKAKSTSERYYTLLYKDQPTLTVRARDNKVVIFHDEFVKNILDVLNKNPRAPGKVATYQLAYEYDTKRHDYESKSTGFNDIRQTVLYRLHYATWRYCEQSTPTFTLAEEKDENTQHSTMTEFGSDVTTRTMESLGRFHFLASQQKKGAEGSGKYFTLEY